MRIQRIKFIAAITLKYWFWGWYSGIWHIFAAIERVGLFECMSWALRGSVVKAVGTEGWVYWQPDEPTAGQPM